VTRFKVIRGNAEEVEQALNALMEDGVLMGWQALIDPDPRPGFAGELVVVLEYWAEEDE